MSLENPFALHYQQPWKERARTTDLPAWVRAAMLAYGTQGPNGHASFKNGEIGQTLGSIDRITGDRVPMSRQNVHRAIRTAVAKGWLANGSTSRCLIVPSHAIQFGSGNQKLPQRPCGMH